MKWRDKLTLSTILQSCVANNNCWRFEMRGSITKFSRMSVFARGKGIPKVLAYYFQKETKR
jgi:hypothetical protein